MIAAMYLRIVFHRLKQQALKSKSSQRGLQLIKIRANYVTSPQSPSVDLGADGVTIGCGMAHSTTPTKYTVWR